ncbi:MAG TPA: hypothetical protein VFI15_06965 [Candidatus Limnocylindrales bacterium]|nr:hypothetical protein [Candidatus Limnocylindrales bacterium]
MGPLLLTTVGFVALITASLILRSFGSRYRIGRLLAAAPRVSIAEARALAESGAARYVRIDGRVDSEEDWEDADHRPLVLRRTAYDWRPAAGGRWRHFRADLEVVPFVVREELDEIAVDGSQIGDGLVTVARQRVGHAADVEAMTAAGIDPGAEARMEVGYVSTVDHAAVLGVPQRGTDGQPVIAPGLGRPLIVSILEDGEAMRVLTGGATGRSRVAVIALGVAGVCFALAVAWWLLDAVVGGGAAAALAASPEPTLRPGSDTRTSGGGPGLVGDPLFAILVVFAVAVLSIAGSLAWIRLTGGRADPPVRREPPKPAR